MAIQANELRIGNWVNRGYLNPEPGNKRVCYEHCLVEVIKPLVVNIVLKDKSIIGKYPIDQLKPIPITPEILEKCGFEKHSDFAPGIGDYNWFENEKHSLIHIHKDFWGIQDVKCKPFKYLHQLQNLYFALTQTELEVKL